MGFFDGLGQIAGLAGSAGIANPTISAGLTGLGAISSLFGGPSAAEQAAAQARREAQGFYSNADTAANYYQNQAATGKAQENLFAPKYEDAFNQALAAHSGAYTSYSPNQSQNRADRLQTAYNATGNAAMSANADAKANLESRGMDAGSSVGAGLAAYNAKNLMSQNSNNVLGLNQQIREEGIQNADYAAEGYGQRLSQARGQASSNTAAQIGYDENRAYGLTNQGNYEQSIAQNEAYQKNQYLGQIGHQIGDEYHRNYQAPKSAGAGMNGQGTAPTAPGNNGNGYGMGNGSGSGNGYGFGMGNGAYGMGGGGFGTYGMGGMGGGVYGMGGGMGGGVYGMGGGMGGGVYGMGGGMGGGVYGMGGGMRGGSGMGGSMSPGQMTAMFSHHTTGIPPSIGGGFGTGSQPSNNSSALGNFGTGIPPTPPPSVAY